MKSGVKGATQHALERYASRSGCKSFVKSLNKLFEKADKGIPIGANQFYFKGWIVVVVRGVIKTAYKPRKKEQQDAVYAAFQKSAIRI